MQQVGVRLSAEDERGGWHTGLAISLRTYAVVSSSVTTPRFACGSMVLDDLFMCGFSALRAEKPHIIENKVPLYGSAAFGRYYAAKGRALQGSHHRVCVG